MSTRPADLRDQFDLVIRGPLIVDGTGSSSYLGDIAIRDDRIAAVGDLPATSEARTEIDVTGSVACPGFIDIHTHSDLSYLAYDQADSSVRQGVTTEVVGNCGFSPFPVENTEAMVALMSSVGTGRVDPEWITCGEYLESVSHAAPLTNIATLAGHGSLRLSVLGNTRRRATDRELREMVRRLSQSFEEGAFGLSTGLTYVPSMYADDVELTRLTSVVAEADRLYATHARGSTAHGFTSIEEALSLQAKTDVRLQYSHVALNHPDLWGRAEDAIELFDRAADKGRDVAYDVYPYDASASALTQYLPEWITEGGEETMKRRLSDDLVQSEAIASVAAGWHSGIPWQWDRIVVASAGAAEYADLEGRTIAEGAQRVGRSPPELVCELCRVGGNAVQAILFYRDPSDVEQFVTHPRVIIASDGVAHPTSDPRCRFHPRAAGTFPRVLARYVKATSRLPLEAAIHSMTGRPAARLGLPDRGVVKVGSYADLVVFDSETVTDRATYDHPRQTPAGISHVIVNGGVVVQEGVLTGDSRGRVLKP